MSREMTNSEGAWLAICAAGIVAALFFLGSDIASAIWIFFAGFCIWIMGVVIVDFYAGVFD